MKIIFRSKRHYYLARVSIFLITVAIIAGMVGCGVVVKYNLTTSSTAGGSVTNPGEDTYTYDAGEVVNLVAEPDEGYRFVEWTGDVDVIDDVNAASATLAMNRDYSITANFVKQYHLTISSTAGGSVTMPGEATYAYDEGEVVSLVARAEEGYHFVDWTGNVSTIANVNATITSITMSSNYTITANFAVDLYFWADANCVLDGPATLPPEQRNSSVVLSIMTNIVIDSVRVDLPYGRSVVIPAYTDVFTPEVDWTTLFRFVTGEPGMPVAGGEYIFTGLDMTGEPILEARNTDIWVGVEPPDPPTNVRAELTEDGILVSWDESPIIPGSFEPAAKPQLGYYQLQINRIGTGVLVYGANLISASPHLIPQDKTDFVQGQERGLSLGEMEDGTYCLLTCAFSVAPEASSGKGLEYNNSDSAQNIIFTIQDGEITIG